MVRKARFEADELKLNAKRKLDRQRIERELAEEQAAQKIRHEKERERAELRAQAEAERKRKVAEMKQLAEDAALEQAELERREAEAREAALRKEEEIQVAYDALVARRDRGPTNRQGEALPLVPDGGVPQFKESQRPRGPEGRMEEVCFSVPWKCRALRLLIEMGLNGNQEAQRALLGQQGGDLPYETVFHGLDLTERGYVTLPQLSFGLRQLGVALDPPEVERPVDL